MLARLPFPIQFLLALVFVLFVGFVLTVGAAVQIYILGWILGVIGGLL